MVMALPAPGGQRAPGSPRRQRRGHECPTAVPVWHRDASAVGWLPCARGPQPYGEQSSTIPPPASCLHSSRNVAVEARGAEQGGPEAARCCRQNCNKACFKPNKAQEEINEKLDVYLHIKSQFPIKTILQEKAFC